MHTQKTWIEISKKALFSNISFFRNVNKKGVKICAVVKANAYGHGLKEVVLQIRDKVDFFAVDNASDALLIRELGIEKPILVMGYIPPAEIKEVIDNKISFVVYTNRLLDKISNLNLNKKAKIHIKLETGLNRQGIKNEDLVKLLKKTKTLKDKIYVEGAYTHFANIEDTLDPGFALQQADEFRKQIGIVKKFGIKPGIIHCSASAGAILYPELDFNMVRVGIGLCGCWPSRETKISASVNKTKGTLTPALTWKSVIAQVKIITSGESVSYGRTWYASRKSKIAVIPIGYSDGYDRGLSSCGLVFINGRRCPVVGRVAMNMIMCDVTDVKDVKEGMEVELIGKNILVDDVAAKIGTINYEVLSRINPLLPRVITN